MMVFVVLPPLLVRVENIQCSPMERMAVQIWTNVSLEVSLPLSSSAHFQSPGQVPSPCCCLCSLTQITEAVEQAQALRSDESSGEIFP